MDTFAFACAIPNPMLRMGTKMHPFLVTLFTQLTSLVVKCRLGGDNTSNGHMNVFFPRGEKHSRGEKTVQAISGALASARAFLASRASRTASDLVFVLTPFRSEMLRNIRNSKLFHEFRCPGRCPGPARRPAESKIPELIN